MHVPMYSNVGSRFAGEALSSGSRSRDGDFADVLEDPHCRHLLEYLRDADGAVAESALARHVVARITGTSPDEVEADVVRRVQTWLHHGQLPVLDEYGAVDFDADAGEVRLGRDQSY